MWLLVLESDFCAICSCVDHTKEGLVGMISQLGLDGVLAELAEPVTAN